MRDQIPYTVPKQAGGWKAFALALLVHVGLIVMLVVGMHWRIEAPAVVQAEIWDFQTREAAPKPQPAPEPEPEPEPEPPPPPKPVEPPPPPPPVQTPPAKDPDIVLAEEKKRKEEEERKRRLEEEQKRKREEEKKLKLEEERKLAEEKKRREEEQRKLAEEKKRKEDEQRKLAEEKKRKEAEARKLAEAKAREEKLATERRKADLDRMMAQAGTGGTGTAAQSQGGRADANYVGRLTAIIKSNTTFAAPPNIVGNPGVEYRVDLLPDGSVKSIQKLQPSGLKDFDAAVERAIKRSEPFPRDDTGKVPSNFTFIHRPKDN